MRELESLATTLQSRRQPVTVFFRDDDAGWGNGTLRTLCERVSETGVELDLAVIPGALDQPTAAELIRLSRQFGSNLNFHQHGYVHANHQQEGRRCEFGSEREIDSQRKDIELGRKLLHETLGELIDPIFTPPWNRCTTDTCKVLSEFDFEAISRISGSTAIEHFGLTDISVAIDWQKKKHGVPLAWTEFCQYAQHYLQNNDVVGVMLHHERLTDDDLDRLCRLIECLRSSDKVEFRSMLQIVHSMCSEQGGLSDAPQ